jgi:hypothetical protein
MSETELKLTSDEVGFVLAVLGNLPTQSNAWPLMQKIKTQAEAQQAKPEEPASSQ